MKRRLICFCLSVFLLLGSVGLTASAASSSSSLSALEDKLAAAATQREAAEKAVGKAENELADALSRKKAIDGKIYALNIEIDALVELISGYSSQIEIKNREIATEKQRLEDKYAVLRQRIRAKREDGGVDLLTILLESRGLSQLFARMDRFAAMLDYDISLLKSYNDGIAELEDKKEELTHAKAELDVKMKELEARKKELERDLSAAGKLVATEENRLASAEADLKRVEAAELEYSNKRAELLADHQKTTNQSYVGGEFLWPLPSSYTKVSSGYGWRVHPVTGKNQFHQGIDIPAPYGTDIYAVNDGTVIECSYNYADGYYITVSHGGGVASFYSHLSKYRVAVGDKVKRGQVIANVGTSGYTTGAHLNLNMYKDNSAVNPLNFFK